MSWFGGKQHPRQLARQSLPAPHSGQNPGRMFLGILALHSPQTMTDDRTLTCQ
jgi:hypothetical protein